MMEHLSKETFKNKVFDFESNQEWSFAGEKPCIIDFYADWCNPCKIVAPILENLAEEYEGKVDIYKVDTEKDLDLATALEIRSIPTVMAFRDGVLVYSQPGAMPPAALEDLITRVKGLDMESVRATIAARKAATA